MSEQRPERESIWSIGRKWLPWYLGAVFALTVGWTAFTAWFEVNSGDHDSLPEIARAVVTGTSPAGPLIPIYALLVISSLDLTGGATVVTYRYLSDKFLKPLHEKLREEGREEERRQWAAWNQRRLDAEGKGQPFDEPPPGTGDDQEQAVEE